MDWFLAIDSDTIDLSLLKYVKASVSIGQFSQFDHDNIVFSLDVLYFFFSVDYYFDLIILLVIFDLFLMLLR